MIFVSSEPTRQSFSPFLVVDRNYLDQERQKPKELYIARPPTWADVVHGADPDTRFLERDQYGFLLSEINRLLLEPLRRGSDRRLPTLFVTGAPGSGKSTLVRHVVTNLVDRGDVLVADLGVNHGRLSIDDLDSYAQGLADLSQSGPPILLLMDDPFFANSGWDLLLERLARPSYSNIAVLGASPTYLYDTYARRIAGRQVILNRFDLPPTTRHERISLAQMYGIEDDSIIDSHEDLLVFAMETATGESFDEIIARIWSTLNDGITVARRLRVEDVQWPVMAFLLTCYLHRHYVMCPEPLLRNALLKVSTNEQTDYVSELSELTLSEGWHIFRISWQASDVKPISLIGAMHARVAERAWQIRPLKTIDPAEWLANASVNAPECVPQLADFILACQSTIDPQDRRFAQRVAEQWQSGHVSTAQLSALVRGIRGSRPAAVLFRRSLRERLRKRDSQSWLAAIELINLARQGSPDRSQLEQIDLPACLKRADLTADSTAAIGILGRHGNPRRRAFVDMLCASLDGKLEWELDSTLLIWLMRNHDASALHFLLPRIYEWLEVRPEEERPRIALIEWYRGQVAKIQYEELQLFFEEVWQWASMFPASRAIPLALFSLIETMAKANVPLPDDFGAELFSLIHLQPEDAYLRERFLALTIQIRDHSTVTVGEVVEETRAWLRDHPDDTQVRAALLGLVRVVQGGTVGEVVEETRAWLRDHPDDTQVRATLLGLVRVVQGGTVGEVVEETRAWLRDHPDDTQVRATLLGLVRVVQGTPVGEVVEETRAWLRDHPDDTQVRAVLLGLVRVVQGGPVGEVVEETRAWLRDHPDDTQVRATLLALVRVVRGTPVGEVVEETRAWLRDHPGDTQVRATLLGLVQAVPGGPAAGEVVEETRAWLRDHPDDTQVRATLLALVQAVQGGPVGEVVEETRAWLRDHPDDTQVRATLLALVRAVPGGPAAGEVVEETRAWLRDHPGDTQVRYALLGLVRAVPGSPAGEVVEETRAWLRDHPGDTPVRAALLGLMRAVPGSPAAGEVVEETRAWLRDHPGDTHVRATLLGLMRAVPGSPAAGEVVEETRAWLRDHPGDTHVRATLLGLMQAVPGSPAAGEVVAETRAWLRDHPGDTPVRAALLGLMRAVPGSPAAGDEMVEETRAWLRDHPGDTPVRAALFGLVQAVPGSPAAGEVVEETRAWLRDHPDDFQVRYELLFLVRAVPGSPAAGEVVEETRAWLRDHPGDTRIRAALLFLVRAVPGGPAGEVVAETRAWLRDHPGDTQVRYELLFLVRAVPGGPAGEVVEETRAWLRDHPGDTRIRAALLGLMRAVPGSPAAGEVVAETRAWLRDHPGDTHVRATLLGLVQAVPGSPAAGEVVAETRAWLRDHPGDTPVRAALHENTGEANYHTFD